MRRLPVYLLVDTSGSMKGEPIAAVNSGLQTLVSSLRRDPQALETAHLSIITFDREARLVLPLTPVAELQLPLIETPDSGPTMTGAALELLCQRVDVEVRTQSTDVKRDWKPILFDFFQLLVNKSRNDLHAGHSISRRLRQIRIPLLETIT